MRHYKTGYIDIGFFVILIVFVLYLIFMHFKQPVVVTGNSMNPTLTNGQILFTTKDFTQDDLHYNDVIYFNSHDTHNKRYIKRIVGLPGDTVQIKNGVFYRNGEEIKENLPLMRNPGCAKSEIVLGKEQYFVLGDNRNNSNDSRLIGPIEFSDICGICQIN